MWCWIAKKDISQDILMDSVLAHVAAAYFSVGKRLERKTRRSATRGFILSTLRGGAALNQNQIATLLGFDRNCRTPSHQVNGSGRACVGEKSKIGESNSRYVNAKRLRIQETLIHARIAADDKLRKEITPEERTTLLRLLKLIAELEF
jgi:hypothetical protein